MVCLLHFNILTRGQVGGRLFVGCLHGSIEDVIGWFDGVVAKGCMEVMEACDS